MQLPAHYRQQSEWTIVGPLGPEVPTSLLSHSLLGIDGGAHWTPQLDVWVGDADSYQKEVQCTHCFQHPKEKDRSDLALGLSLFNEQILYRLHLWGFSGGRFDHEIINLGEICAFLKDHPESEAILYDEKGKPTLSFLGAGDWRFERHGTFSVGCVETVRMKLKGDCRYPILKESRLKGLSSFGLSNEGFGTMTLITDGPVFIFFPETP